MNARIMRGTLYEGGRGGVVSEKNFLLLGEAAGVRKKEEEGKK